MPVMCDYLANANFGPWVRWETCQFAKRNSDGVDGVYVGQRQEFRPIMSMDRGKCREGDKKDHIRYRIGDGEWVCLY
jgi:hypothetical protein